MREMFGVIEKISPTSDSNDDPISELSLWQVVLVEAHFDCDQLIATLGNHCKYNSLPFRLLM